MGLTYFGGEALLNYLYNDAKDADGGILLNNYDSFLIQLIRTDGNAYDSQSGADSDAVAVTRVGANWNIDGNIVTNANDLTFPPSDNSNSQSIVGFELYIDGIGETPELFATGTLNTPITIQQGETPIIRAYNASSGDGLEINIDSTSRYTQDFREKIYKYLFLAEDSLNSVVEYQFIVYNTSGNPTPLEFYLTRDSNVPNWDVSQRSDYARAENSSDIVLPLNNTNANIITNQIRMFYSQGTFPNFTYTYAGAFETIQVNNLDPVTYTIANGETARFQVGELRIFAR